MDMEVLRVEVMKLSLKPGDRLVIWVPESYLAHEEFVRFQKYLREFLGPDIPGLILGNDITLSVIEPAENLFE